LDLSSTIHFLGDVLGQVIIRQESLAIFELEERVRDFAKTRRSAAPGSLEQIQDASELQAKSLIIMTAAPLLAFSCIRSCQPG
jgi:phosphoenolpyruvate carboxylase